MIAFQDIVGIDVGESKVPRPGWGKYYYRDTAEEVLEFFQFWIHHPHRKRLFISGQYVVFEYTHGRHIHLAEISTNTPCKNIEYRGE